jgi:hypothetical protein
MEGPGLRFGLALGLSLQAWMGDLFHPIHCWHPGCQHILLKCVVTEQYDVSSGVYSLHAYLLPVWLRVLTQAKL